MNTVTKEEVLANMQNVICRTVVEFGKPTTYVTVRMRNGFTLRESTTCVDPLIYNEEEGKRICLQRIEEKIWFLLGYMLQEKLAFPPKLSIDKSEKTNNTVIIPTKEYNNLVKRSKILREIEKQETDEFFKSLLGRKQNASRNGIGCSVIIFEEWRD